MKLTLVVSTLGRTEQLPRLFRSLAAQTFRDFEVIIVDQNKQPLPREIIGAERWPFPLRHIHTPDEKGLSRGRNRGWAEARGDVVLFPDDDCWYPPDLLRRAIDIMTREKVDVVSGRAADESGRSINGRYVSRPTRITRRNAFTTQIEWMVFIKKTALERIGGYDTSIGVGSSTPWQACEGPDLVLRAIALGIKARYDPSLYGHHKELNIKTPDAAMRSKGRAYARGLGYVLRRHGYGVHEIAYWAARSSVNLVLAAFQGKPARAGYYANVLIGRLEGYLRLG